MRGSTTTYDDHWRGTTHENYPIIVVEKRIYGCGLILKKCRGFFEIY
jgi:hypothetical protein